MAPVVLGMPALAQGYVTEDGYLMLTVARNLAIGLGLSVSDGTIATNGVQPLATLIYAVPYALTSGDKVTSLQLLHALWAAIAVAGGFAVRAFAGRILGPMGLGPVWAWLAAALWFCGPLLARHSMNGLETGLYTLLILLACLQFMRVVERGTEVSTGNLVLMAALLGLVFLGRNDGIFLVFSFFVVWLVHAVTTLGLGMGDLLRRLALPAVVCASVVAPWLIHNQLLFGSVVPISGPAQSMTAAFGNNATLVPAVLFEQMFPMLPIPGRFEQMPAVMAVAGSAVLGVLALFVWRSWRVGGAVRLVVMGYLFHAIAVSTYYGLFFGAAHFMSRYTAPLAPLLIVALVVAGWETARLMARQRAVAVLSVLGIASLVLSLGLLSRSPWSGQGHFQVVRWVDENVPADTWVGAVQTGTLGYWHDRTINLDGKVNPLALDARRQIGHVLHYVTASEITYLADWVGIAGWVDREGFGAYFEVVEEDPNANLGVLRRR
ncbi:hypothetical protein CCR87_02955 [Rhodobaculum claviforme]|uniref:Uncharacterized protein n=2 Tax=Rhodobaculum claviforme TaxID=1549854 RepID=A0A934TJF7_9RHOB|nr:hypothetical protein [Rhodobaculum claviforme]